MLSSQDGKTLLFRLLLVLCANLAAAQNEVTVERDVPVKMRDGIVLHADIYRPKTEGKYPVLLQRTPYNKDGGVEFGVKAVARGYVTIIQDVRGRFSSDGEWYTFKHESDDGYDTVEWAAALPYSNGKVGMFGGSYVGATQMLAAMAQPPNRDLPPRAARIGCKRGAVLLAAGTLPVPFRFYPTSRRCEYGRRRTPLPKP